MKKTTNIALTVLAVLGLATILYLITRKKPSKDTDSGQPKPKPSDTPTTTEFLGCNLNEADKTNDYKKIEAKLSYINETLDTLTLENGKIVGVSSGDPLSEGLLQYTWIAHNRKFNEVKKEIDNSINRSVQRCLKPMLDKTISRNNSIFDPKIYNDQASWYINN